MGYMHTTATGAAVAAQLKVIEAQRRAYEASKAEVYYDRTTRQYVCREAWPQAVAHRVRLQGLRRTNDQPRGRV